MDWQTVRLWGSLGPDVRKALLSGRDIPISSLSSGSRAILNQLVFRSEWGVNSARMGGDQVEPTEKLPDGFTDEAVLRAGLASQNLMWSWSRVDGAVVGLKDPVSAVLSDADASCTYQPAVTSTLELMVRATTGKWFIGTVRDHLWVDRRTEPLPLLNWPKPFLKEVAERLTPAQWQTLPDDFRSKFRQSAGLP
jgi:hypothetical protein